MTSTTIDSEQNVRLREVEQRVNKIESDVAALLARLDTLILVGKGLGVMAGLAFGIDLVPMMQGGI